MEENLHHFIEHSFKELVGFLVAGTQVVAASLGVGTAEFGICGRHFGGVSGHLYLGNDLNASQGGIVDEITHLGCREVASVCSGSAFIAILFSCLAPVFPVGLRTPCGISAQAGIFLYFQTPSGGVGKVEMQTVELHLGHRVHFFLQEIKPVEMS